MNDRRYNLTPALMSAICELIRDGRDPYLAAQANGIPPRIFDRWMGHGRARRARPRYRAFADAVDVALAQARCRADSQVAVFMPSPGLENTSYLDISASLGLCPDSNLSSVEEESAEESPEEIREFVLRILGVLTPYPEVRRVAALGLLRDGELPEEAAEAVRALIASLEAVPVPTSLEKTTSEQTAAVPARCEPAPDSEQSTLKRPNGAANP